MLYIFSIVLFVEEEEATQRITKEGLLILN